MYRLVTLGRYGIVERGQFNGRGPTGPEMQRKVILLCTAFHSVTAVLTTATCFNPGWLCATDFNCPRAYILAFTPLAVLRSPAAQRRSVTGIKSTKAVAERPKSGFKSCEELFNLEVSEKLPGPQYYKHTKQMKQNVNHRIEYDRHQDNPRRFFLKLSVFSTFTVGMSIFAGSPEGRYELTKILVRARRRYLLQ